MKEFANWSERDTEINKETKQTKNRGCLKPHSCVEQYLNTNINGHVVQIF